MKPTIYSSIDADAPKLEYVAGSFNTLIKACLVTGYGDKQSAGWQTAFEDMESHKLAIRSSNLQSQQCVLLLDDKANNGKVVDVTSYLSWDSDTNTGVDEWGSGKVNKDWEHVSDTPYWVLLATDKCFYFWVQCEPDSRSMGVISGFGDANMLRNDMQLSWLMVTTSTSTSYAKHTTGRSTVQTSHDKSASYPSSLHQTLTDYWGDRSPDTLGYKSRTAIFSRFAMYLEVDERRQPVFEMPGMLMPYSEIWGYRLENHTVRLDEQYPYSEPLVGLYQPWHGRVWLQVDDWG